MKKITYTATLLLLVFSVSLLAQSKQDINAIKAMCGCYEVRFNFAETFSYPEDSSTYKPSKQHHSGALEWVELIDNTPQKLSLQHLLIVKNGTHIIKHWRQDWLFENTQLYQYDGLRDNIEKWTFVSLPKNSVKGQWTQKVYQVDDEPRYEGTATWVHVDGRHLWENKTDAPLPRREHTQRSDYNLLERTNTHEIISTGWVHDQDNKKIMRGKNGDERVLAEEKGYNTYTKVDDARCAVAQKWWQENKGLWEKVRRKWAQELAKNKTIKLHYKVDGKLMYEYLFDLAADASQASVNAIIDRFIIR